MPKANELLQTIEAVHAAGLDETLWPVALRLVTDVIGASGTTFEVVDKSTGRLSDFWSFGIPPTDEIDYIDHFVTINPRMPLHRLIDVGDIGYDSLILDETAMNRDPYYCEFLPRMGLRYFVSTFLINSPRENVTVAAQRSPAQGHAGNREIALMRTLTPHLRQAFDVTRRLRGATAAARALEGALDWLSDGVALIAHDGAVLYANETLQGMARGKGIAIRRGELDFDSPDAKSRFEEALGTVTRLRGGDFDGTAPLDFLAARPSNAPPYLVSLRPLARSGGSIETRERGVAIVFVRDTLQQDAAGAQLLVEMFGFTPAEAALARAIQAGVSLDRYARERALSLNTVYTHLRRLKEKTGCSRMSELILKFKGLQIPIRSR